MKTIFILLISSVLLSSCSCMLGQIPPITIYCASGCTAPIPDIKSKVPVWDNCEIKSYTQFPLPGFLLTPAQKSVTVTLTATDASGNTRIATGIVTMVDTIKPVFDFSKLAYQKEQVEKMYEVADRAATYLNFDMTELEVSQYPELVRFISTAKFNRLVIVKR